MEPAQLTPEARLIAAAEPRQVAELLAEMELTGIRPEEFLLPEVQVLRPEIASIRADPPAGTVSTQVDLLQDLVILPEVIAQAEAAL